MMHLDYLTITSKVYTKISLILSYGQIKISFVTMFKINNPNNIYV